jgi:branched-chain amino acid transport system substrate-binding protein
MALCCVVSILVAFWARSPAADDKPFRIGAVLPRTGPYSQFGDLVEQGMRVGVKRVNAMGGILGRKVELVFRDDASNPGRTVLAAKELLGEQQVDFLYPEIISPLVLAVLPYTTEQKALTITQGASPQVGDAAKFPYSFQYGDLALKRAPAMVAAMKKLGGQKVGILVSTNPATVAVGDALAADLPKRYGMQVAGYKQFTVDVKDLASQLQTLRDAGADIVAFDGPARDNVRVVMTGMQTLGWNAKVVSEPSNLFGDLTEQVPESVQKQYFSVNYRVGTRTGAASPPLDAFIKELKEIGPIQNLPFNAWAHDIVFLVKWAHETAKKEKGNTSGDALKAVLENIGNSEYPSAYSLMLGNPRYTAKDHTTGQADYSKLWGLIHVSKPIDGRYEGEDLAVKE